MVLEERQRHFLPNDYTITTWEELKPYFDELVSKKIESTEEYSKWLKNKSELESMVSENFAWRYIKMTCNTANESLQKNYQDFVQHIQPQLASYGDILNKKTLEEADKWSITEDGYAIMIRGIEESVRIFREENIPLSTEIQLKQAEYQSITGAMNVVVEGEEMTMPKAASLLLNTNRELREKAWMAISERRYQDIDILNTNFSELLELRNQVALNSDFKNFRDYMFSAMGRFDYTPEDCFDFHESVKEAVLPIVNKIELKRKEKLGTYRPWDGKVDVDGKSPLKPFESAEELLDKTEVCFTEVNPKFADYIKTMRSIGHFDVDSRKGKAPGGYNYPLEEIGMPFIFMNATATTRDMVTMVHEGGHAIHSFEVRELPINAYRNPPMEVAELASMSMELISMEHWGAYFNNPEDLKRAKREHLSDVVSALPWIATIDKFQHWIYENPNHSLEERKNNWLNIQNEFSDTVTDWSGLERFKENSWQKQLHIYEVPFYYIEYGMAQLGAISIWRNYKKDPEKTIAAYTKALQLGHTKDIKEIYSTAGIKFDFSKAYIAELMEFVENELELLEE